MSLAVLDYAWEQRLNVNHCRTLLRLSAGPLGPHDLAKALDATTACASLTLETLRDKGLVEEYPDPGDRRRRWHRLTLKGKGAAIRLSYQPLESKPSDA